jgi:sulfite exporter TauE/SafE
MESGAEISTLAVLGIGFLLGLQHAVEADHLAAVSTIVSEKKSLLSASVVGGLWGLGHTISLFVVGALIIFLKLQISETAEARFEALVGAMLIVLGINAIRKLSTAESVHLHRHEHGAREHVHIHTHGDQRVASHHRFSPRSVLIGMAGSAALMLFVVPTIPSPITAFAYILIFGIGSTGGMMAMSFLIGLPMHLTINRFAVLNKGLRLVAGSFSLILGLHIVYEKLQFV